MGMVEEVGVVGVVEVAEVVGPVEPDNIAASNNNKILF